MFNKPLAYFITFRTFGTWLHGDSEGSVDRRHNRFGDPVLPPSEPRLRFETAAAKQPPVEFSREQRMAVNDSIRAVCEHNGWRIHALNVRTNHVHVVVYAERSPEQVMTAFKAWSTRRLRELGLSRPETKIWSRHGSTIYIFRPEKLAEKIDYVNNQQ